MSSRLRSSLTNKTSSSFNTSEISELSGNEESSAQFDSADEQRRADRNTNTKPSSSSSFKYEESDDVFEDEGVNVSGGSGDEDFIKTIVLEGKPPWGFTIIDESSQPQAQGSQKGGGRKQSDSSVKKLTPNYIVHKVFPKSIAARADLCEGDVLLFINDLTANELNIDDLNMLINTSPKLKIIVTSASPQIHVSEHVVLNTQRINSATSSSSQPPPPPPQGDNKKTIRIGTNKLINNPYFNAAASLNGNTLTGVNGAGVGAGLGAQQQQHQHHHHHHHRHAAQNAVAQQLALPNLGVGAGSNAAFGNASVLGNNGTLNANDYLKSLHQHFETNENHGSHANHANLASSSLNNFNSFANPAAGSLNASNLLGNLGTGSFRNNSFNAHKAHQHSHNSGSGSQNYLNYHQNHHHQSQKNLLNYSKTNDNLNINNINNTLTHTHPRYRTNSLNSNYRNYFSATESCGEDCDESSAGYTHQPRRRFNNNFDNKFLTSKLDQINTNFVNNLNLNRQQPHHQHQIPSSHRHAAANHHFPRANNANLNSSLLNQSAGLDDSFEKKNVSYASINLKQPLKDFNYFSDSEGTAASNRIKYRNNSTPSASLKQQQKFQLQQQQQQQFGQAQGGIEPLTQEQIAALDSVFGADTPQPSETPTPNNFNNYNNFGAGNTMNMNNNSFQFSLPQYQQQQQQNVAKSAHGFSKLNSFNTKPQGFVPYGGGQETSSSSAAFQSFASDQSPSNKYGGSWSQQNQGAPYSPGMLNKSSNSSNFGFQPQPQGGSNKGMMHDENYYIQQLQNQYQQQQQQQRQAKSEYVDPMEAKYEREMGSELHKPLSKQNYSDSYFYNSSVFNYPTIDDQKKLAKSIADTLEGSKPTSKYHKKKQIMFKDGNGYESETAASPTAQYNNSSFDFNYPQMGSGGNANSGAPAPDNSDIMADNPAAYYQKYYEEYTNNLNESNNEDPVIEKYVYDETLPEVIKRSIAQASMTDPVRMVQAPDSFKQAHFTEHTTHTQMPPKAAMSLAAALESEQANGGRGAQIFQKRKQRSEKWVVDESNVKKNPFGFPVQPTPTQMMPPVEQPPMQNYNLPSNQNNNKNFLDFNAKPRGWNNYSDPKSQPNQMPRGYQDLEYAIKALSEGIDHQRFEKSPSPPSHQKLSSPPVPPVQPVQQSSSKFDMNPNKIDLSNWSQSKNGGNDENKQPLPISKDGVQNIKAKFMENMSSQMSTSPPKKPVKLSSHENYLYNTKNSQLKMQNDKSSSNNNNNSSNQQQQQMMNYAQRNASGGKFNPSMVASSDL